MKIFTKRDALPRKANREMFSRMAPQLEYKLNTFSASEAEEITGIPQATQRDWRRRGFLPAISGKAKFDVFDLSRMLLMARLSSELPLAEAAAIAALAGPTVAANALYIRPSIAGLPEDLKGPVHLEICARYGHEARSEKYLIVWSGGSFVSFVDDIGSAFAGNPSTIFVQQHDGQNSTPTAAASSRIFKLRDEATRRDAQWLIEIASAEERVVALQSGRVSVFNLEQFGSELIPLPSYFAPNKRPLATAAPKKSAP